MKSRLMICLMLLAMFAVPALADTIAFTNRGTVSGSLMGGVSASSVVNSLTFDGTLIGTGPIGLLQFDTGTFTGSLSHGGSFTGGDFTFTFGGGALIMVNNFMGTLTKIGDDLYDLVGTFSGTSQGIHFTGSTNQVFSSEDDDHGRRCFKDLHGTTTIVTTAVPEPGSLTLFGTGLIALAGAVRRKLQAGRAA